MPSTQPRYRRRRGSSSGTRKAPNSLQRSVAAAHDTALPAASHDAPQAEDNSLAQATDMAGKPPIMRKSGDWPYQAMANSSEQALQSQQHQNRANAFSSGKGKPHITPMPQGGANAQKKGLIQRYLIINNEDYTRWYRGREHHHRLAPDRAARVQNDLTAKITEIAVSMVNALDPNVPLEKKVQDALRADAGGLLRAQITKWIEARPGTMGPRSNPIFGRKYQPRIYTDFKDAAMALYGWVVAKGDRRRQKVLARQVQTSEAISFHLDSVLLRIDQWIRAHARSAEMLEDLRTKRRVGAVGQEKSWDIYQGYFAGAGLGQGTTLPDDYRDVLANPHTYDVRQKTGILHDIMHYFYEKRAHRGDIDLLDVLPTTQATVSDGAGGTQRVNYNRPRSSQIRDHQKDAAGLVRPDALPRDANGVVASTEEQDESYKLARDKGIAMYGRHSYSAARMMRIAQHAGATNDEIGSVAWAIMAFWRLNYDHRSIPYHTLHEVMDFTPDFGLAYDVDNRQAGLEAIENDGFITHLRTMVEGYQTPRYLTALIATDTASNNVAWFLSKPALWGNQTIYDFIKDTALTNEQFTAIDAAQWTAFYMLNPTTKGAFATLNTTKRRHVTRHLKQAIVAHGRDADILALLEFYSNVRIAAFFLRNQALWANARVFQFLTTTVLPMDEFRTLSRHHLRSFFDYNAETRRLFALLPQDRQDHVNSRNEVAIQII